MFTWMEYGYGVDLFLIAVLAILVVKFLSLNRDNYLNKVWHENTDWCVADHIKKIDGLEKTVEVLAKKVKDYEWSVEYYRKALEAILAQEVELTKMVTATNERFCAIQDRAEEVLWAQKEFKDLTGEFDKKNQLIQEDVKKLYGRTDDLSERVRKATDVYVGGKIAVESGVTADAVSHVWTPEELKAMEKSIAANTIKGGCCY